MTFQPYYVFRSGHERLPFRPLLDGLGDDVASGRYVDALVRAGEIESALEDEGAETAACAATLTDALAAAIVGSSAEVGQSFRDLAQRAHAACALEVRAPEAFSYYGLDPRDVAAVLATPPLQGIDRACVVGVRSIGTTMSAVVAAAIRARGGVADRRTVRPEGDPFNRRTVLSDGTRAEICRHAAIGSHVIVVDEGPGLSGSSLLSVVDALADAGVPRARVHTLCTRIPDPASLVASDGAGRWSALEVTLVPRRARWPAGCLELCPDSWRLRFLGAHRRWPASCAWTERPKALDAGRRRILKWEGLGRHGAQTRSRAEALGAAGFGPPADRSDGGFVDYELVDGQTASPRRIGSEILERLADYCAWRAATLPAPAASSELSPMVRRNAEVAFGRPVEVELSTERAVVPDARMMPCEWIAALRGPMVKCDASLHGDDHLFPGPCDVAWDLAGAIVEWEMTRDGVACFLRRYTRRSGDDPAPRLPGWLFAYAVHRVALTEFSSQTTGEPESGRFRREAARYRRWLARSFAAFDSEPFDSALCSRRQSRK